MGKRTWSVLAVLAAVGVGAAYWVIEIANPSNGTQLTLLPQPEGSGLAWPVNHVWTWRFSLPPDAPRSMNISLDIREKSRPGEWPQSHSPHEVLKPWEADHVFLGGVVNFDSSRTKSGLACIQLIDLAEAGIESATRPSPSLRALASLSLGGATATSGPGEIHLPAGRFAAESWEQSGNWNNGELYLGTFEIQDSRGIYQYDVVLKSHSKW